MVQTIDKWFKQIDGLNVDVTYENPTPTVKIRNFSDRDIFFIIYFSLLVYLVVYSLYIYIYGCQLKLDP